MRCVLIKMGGKGVRFGEDIPKQFCEINGKPLFSYVLEQYVKVECVDKFVIVTNGDWLEYTFKYANNILRDKLLEVIQGGETNAKSIYNGVMCAKKYLKDDDILLIHDITDPIVASDKIEEVIKNAEKYNIAALYTEQLHSIYEKNEENFVVKTIPKQNVGPGYSPEAFKFDKIYNCYRDATEEELKNMASAVSLVAAHNEKIKLIPSNILNLKITYRTDLDILEKIINGGLLS